MHADEDIPLELFIGEENRIRQEVVAPSDGPIAPGPVIDATVTFTIRKYESYTAAFVGLENNSMAHEDAAPGWYSSVWPRSQSTDLKKNRAYWLHLDAPGYTQRLIKCVAKYRGNK